MLIYEDAQAVCLTAAASFVSLLRGLFGRLVFLSGAGGLFFFGSLFGCLLVYVAVGLVCLHPSVVYMCMRVC